MKSVGIQYLEAIRYLKEDGVRLKRTIHVTFVPGDTFLYIATKARDFNIFICFVQMKKLVE